jgi:hypothetical protein
MRQYHSLQIVAIIEDKRPSCQQQDKTAALQKSLLNGENLSPIDLHPILAYAFWFTTRLEISPSLLHALLFFLNA